MGHLASTGYSLSMDGCNPMDLFLPKLHTLALTNNQLTNLVEIDPLASLPKLQFLSLLDNNITKKPNYRLYVIHKLKSLRLLDFKKVKHKVLSVVQNSNLDAILLAHENTMGRIRKGLVQLEMDKQRWAFISPA
ncbi:U2 small nuclear ribonucleoprotein A' [Camellia lanceoleosa]|uniref:U2 small nuclear ribonucleoprotein A n=1 Tax=Camellia lanceoleosa TaxID=1840588 RepID=A0ACC0F2W2_9ERIC|nr:U2 small nuclear ribonucleoprotein A' [Camellia lanceoleosa]